MAEPTADEAVIALQELDAALETSVAELNSARDRIERVLAAKADGATWLEVESVQDGPLVVASVTTVLDRLAAVGSRFRRAEAQALHREGLSMERVAMLFGVTRQRVSALLREREVS